MLSATAAAGRQVCTCPSPGCAQSVHNAPQTLKTRRILFQGRTTARPGSPLVAARGGSAAAALPSLQLQQQHEQGPALLDWLVQYRDATPACLKVERRYIDDTVGYCLTATADIEPGEVILSVPLTAAITSEGVGESRWSIAMATQLLELQQEAAAAATATAGGDGQLAAARSAAPWLQALPQYVDLPWLYWSDDELAELQDEDTIAEAQQLRAVYEQASQELGGRFPRQQVARALSLVHSRSFVMAGCHIWVPGIDMCNHALQNNADIRCVHSPGSCQGADALDEVCPPETAAAHSREPSRFELFAGEDGIAAGEEVTISYGAWPSDVFLLFFGFAPAANPHDSAVLFYDLFDLATFKQRLVAANTTGSVGGGSGAAAGTDEELWNEVEEMVQQLEAQLGPQQQFFRMVATAAGIDSRLLDAAQALLLAGRGSPSGQPMSLPQFLRQRCTQLLASYPTSLEEDERVLQQLELAAPGSGSGSGGLQLPPGVRQEQLVQAVRFRLSKKQVLHATLSGLPA